MGASISTWIQWEDSSVQNGQRLQDTIGTQEQPVTMVERDENQAALHQTQDDAVIQGQGGPVVQHQEAGPVVQRVQASGVVVHNSGPSMFHGAQNLTFNGGSYTMIIQQAGSDVDRECLSKVLDFLSLVNFRSIQAENLAKWTEGTLKAFIEGNMFQLWLVTQCAILWGTGMPGAGKTILASIVIQYLDTFAAAANDICVAFVYCRYTEPMAVRDILAALVRQLLERYPHLLAIIEPVYKKHNLQRTQPSQLELIGLIRYICSLFRVSFFSIDGLDEALYDEQFDLLETLTSIKANFILTSRPLVRLKNVLPNAKFFEISAQEGDVALLVSDRIDRSPDLREILETDEAREQVIQKVCEVSCGMFLHASLMLEAVRECTSLGEVKELLGKLPPKLDVLYDEAFKRIRAQGEKRAALAERVLMWLVYAFQPLSVSDLQYAVAKNPQSDWGNEASLVPESLLVSVCCGLVTVEPNQTWSRDTVRLVHYTALDALRRLLGPYEVSPHCQLAEICVERLVYCGITHSGRSPFHEVNYQGRPRRLRRSRRALLKYAYEAWHLHANSAIPEPAQPGLRPVPSILHFLSLCTSFPAIDSMTYHNGSHILFGAMALPIHIISFYHIPSLLPLVEPHVNDRMEDGKSALSIAAHRDGCAVAEHLLAMDGIEVNSQDDDGNTALIIAANAGSADMVAFLLRDSRVDIRKRNNSGNTALHCALEPWTGTATITSSHTQAALHLIAAPGVDVNATGQYGRTPLMLAYHHPLRLLDSLLQHPQISPHVTDDDGWTPLMNACRWGSSSALQWHLRIPGVQTKDKSGATALFHRAHYGDPIKGHSPAHYLADFQALVAAGIKPNDKNAEGLTALMYSVQDGWNVNAIQAFTELEGVDANLQDNLGRTALLQAFPQGIHPSSHEPEKMTAIVATLIKWPEVDINGEDEHGLTVLEHAAIRGVLGTLDALVASFESSEVKSVTLEYQDDRRKAQLHAAGFGHDDGTVFELLELPELAIQCHLAHNPGEYLTSWHLFATKPGLYDAAHGSPQELFRGRSYFNDVVLKSFRRLEAAGFGFPWLKPWIRKEDAGYAKLILDHPAVDERGLGCLRHL